MSQIIVENLTKTYQVFERPQGLRGAVRGLFQRQVRVVHALNGVNFQIESGELVGYIGPNGAGKSTTVKILSGILVPDSGRVEIMGRVPWVERVEHVNQIGVVFGQRTQLWWDVPVLDSFELLRDIYRVPGPIFQHMLDELVDVLDLQDLLLTPLRQLSLGQRMRCELAGSLLHQPPLVFLDEPTIGLDAVSKLKVRDFLKRHNREHGTTIILTTHDMDDIEALCSRVMVIGHGSILFDGSVDALRQKYAPERKLTIEVMGEPPRPFEMAESIVVDGQKAVILFDPARVPVPEMIAKVTAQCSVKDLVVENLPIEEIVSRMYREAAL